MAYPIDSGKRRHAGFSLIELAVVLAVMALLLSVATPRYIQSQSIAKEAVLKENLIVLRKALDQFTADRGVAPRALLELVDATYLKKIPVDPMTEQDDTWEVVMDDSKQPPTIRDVQSGSKKIARDGSTYAQW
jgi:general secretion pathway protein G